MPTVQHALLLATVHEEGRCRVVAERYGYSAFQSASISPRATDRPACRRTVRPRILTSRHKIYSRPEHLQGVCPISIQTLTAWRAGPGSAGHERPPAAQPTLNCGESKQAGKPSDWASPNACDRSTGPTKQASTPGTDSTACGGGAERMRRGLRWKGGGTSQAADATLGWATPHGSRAGLERDLGRTPSAGRVQMQRTADAAAGSCQPSGARRPTAPPGFRSTAASRTAP